MTLPRLTVIMPSFNQAGFLEEAIRSILDKGYANLEIINGHGWGQHRR
jgi:glycosyltransferase involved in cell wall biosynthesis